MPPQAARKSPEVRFLRRGVLGEWSEDATTMALLPTAARSAARFSALRSGGAHLKCVAPSATSSAAKRRWCAHASTVMGRPSAWACRNIEAVSAGHCGPRTHTKQC